MSWLSAPHPMFDRASHATEKSFSASARSFFSTPFPSWKKTPVHAHESALPPLHCFQHSAAPWAGSHVKPLASPFGVAGGAAGGTSLTATAAAGGGSAGSGVLAFAGVIPRRVSLTHA